MMVVPCRPGLHRIAPKPPPLSIDLSICVSIFCAVYVSNYLYCMSISYACSSVYVICVCLSISESLSLASPFIYIYIYKRMYVYMYTCGRINKHTYDTHAHMCMCKGLKLQTPEGTTPPVLPECRPLSSLLHLKPKAPGIPKWGPWIFWFRVRDTKKNTILSELDRAVEKLGIRECFAESPFSTGPCRSIALANMAVRDGEGEVDCKARMHGIVTASRVSVL